MEGSNGNLIGVFFLKSKEASVFLKALQKQNRSGSTI